jgi:hypothetical protein
MTKIFSRTAALAASVALLLAPFASRPSFAEDHEPVHRERMYPEHMHPEQPAKKPPKAKKKNTGHAANPMSPDTMPVMDHGPGHAHHEMKGLLGPYGMGREGSGTSWQPDNSPHQGIHAQYGEWMTMWNALFNGVYDKQGGQRGDSRTFVSGMVMAMAERQVDASTFGLRTMVSPDPFMGPSDTRSCLPPARPPTAGHPLSIVNIPMTFSWNWQQPIRTRSPRHRACISTRACREIPRSVPRRSCTGRAASIIRKLLSLTIGSTAPTSATALSPGASFSTRSSLRLRPSAVASPINSAMTSRPRSSIATQPARVGIRPASFQCRSPGGTLHHRSSSRRW